MGDALARPPIRLLALLGLLTVVAALGIPRIISEVSGVSAASGCSLGNVPQAARLTAATVRRDVDASGIKALIGAGSLDVQGFQQTFAAWSDTPPPVYPSNIGPSTVIDGGYEVLWWSPQQDHQAASMFIFRGPGDAARYVRAASSSRCRSKARTYRLASPAGARALVWVNPLGVIQADVYFSRGDRVYRLGEVAPGNYQSALSGPGARLLIGTSQLLVCELKGVRCANSVG